MMNNIDESKASKLIVEEEFKDISEILSNDVAIIGTDISGLVASYYLSKLGYKTVLVSMELNLNDMIKMYNVSRKILIEKSYDSFLNEANIRYESINENFFVIDSLEFIVKLLSLIIDSNVKIISGINIEDLIYRDKSIIGLVLSYGTNYINMRSKAIVDATGYKAEVVSILSRKFTDLEINIKGEGATNFKLSNELIVDYTGRIMNGLYVTGCSVASIYNLPKPGPILTPLLKSGEKIVEIIDKDLKEP